MKQQNTMPILPANSNLFCKPLWQVENTWQIIWYVGKSLRRVELLRSRPFVDLKGHHSRQVASIATYISKPIAPVFRLQDAIRKSTPPGEVDFIRYFVNHNT